jgi:pimeloyl-ACP methyl ester carboxylesterase
MTGEVHPTLAAFDALGIWLEATWAQEPEIRIINAAGVAISCRIRGDDDGKPGLLFVHGFRATGQWWDHIAPHFADRFRVVAMDLSGMGDSGTRDRYSRTLHGMEILGVIEALALNHTTIVGHSYGTVVSLHAARTDPDPINRMILIV